MTLKHTLWLSGMRLKQSLRERLNLDRKRGKTKLDLMATFPLYQPCSAGTYVSKARLTIQTINQLIPSLEWLLESLGCKRTRTQVLDELPSSDEQNQNAAELKSLLDKHRSDKSSTHNYHLLYGHILKNRSEVRRVFEIGLGTNNTDVVSHMGPGRSPGASLRAFRDFFADADIFGADVDRRVLFAEQRIRTFWVDQTDRASFEPLKVALPDDFDLMIDDGLHSPDANLHSLEFFLPKLRIGGWAIIEDVAEFALPLWEIVGASLPSKYDATIFKTRQALVFAVQRVQ